MSNSYPTCIATAVTSEALKLIREAGNEGGRYKATHPWIVGAEHLARAREAGQSMGMIFFDLDEAAFSHWAWLRAIDVAEFHRGSWETRCEFEPLTPVPEIWRPVDALMLAPSAEQLHREDVEPIGIHRTPCTARDLSPYALCEAPPFMG